MEGRVPGFRRRTRLFALTSVGAIALGLIGAPHPVSALTVQPALSSPTSFLAVGDSLTYGYGNPGPSWPVELDSRRDDFRLVRNAGLLGNTTAHMRTQLSREVNRYRPDYVFIFAGIIDLATCVPVTTIVTNIKALVVNAYAQGTRRVVLVLNSHDLPMKAKSGHPCGPGMNGRIDQLDDSLATYGIAAGVQTIDLRRALDTNGRYDPANFLEDGIHYNARGVDLLCQAIDRGLSGGFNRFLRGAR